MPITQTSQVICRGTISVDCANHSYQMKRIFILEAVRKLCVLKANTDCECVLNCKTFNDRAAALAIIVWLLTTLVRVCYRTSHCAICGGAGKALSPVLQFFSSFAYH